MILGLGCDLISVARVRGVWQRHPQAFLDRVYTAEEQAYCLLAKDPAERLAARWAAKEAAMKALGSGWAAGVGFTQIAVSSLPSGQPVLSFSGVAAERFAQMGGRVRHISLSHADGFAVAMVIVEG